MLRIASVTGFGCMVESADNYSAYRNVEPLSTYRPSTDVNLAHFKNMEGWLRHVNITLPKPYTNVCYGGNFAVRASQIKKHPYDLWKGLESSLDRLDIGESHEDQYAMYSWAGLLTEPLSERYRNAFKDISMGNTVNSYSEMLPGSLVKNMKTLEVKDFDQNTRGTLTSEVIASVEAMWTGGAVGGDSNSFNRIFVVLSYCKHKLLWFPPFISEFSVHNVTVYERIKCINKMMNKPKTIIDSYNSTIVEVGRTLSEYYAYASWMADMAPELNDDDVVVFLRDDPIPKHVVTRSLREMLRIASVTGFGCMAESVDNSSAYHDVEYLSTYRPLTDVNSSHFNMEGWLRHVNITLPKPYTNVCYGGNFAVRASQIKKHPYDLWKGLESSLDRLHFRESHEDQYAMYSLAGLLTEPLSERYSNAITSRGNTVNSYSEMIIGSLINAQLQPFYSEVDVMWRGDVHGGDLKIFRRIYIVVSHCTNKLDWLKQYLQGFDIYTITIYSKCTASPVDAPEGATLLRLPNVGRCDHTYAHWMATMASTLNDNDVVVFLKDSTLVHQEAKERNLYDMLRIASITGFGCRLEVTHDLSAYHLVSDLLQYKKSSYQRLERDKLHSFNSSYINMGHWLSSIGGSIPEPYAQVCYGGVFVAKASQIKSKPPGLWSAMAKSLSREDNIEEGHYAERSWAGLLAVPISKDGVRSLYQYSQGTARRNVMRFSDYRGSISLTRPSIDNFSRDAHWKGDTTDGDLSVFKRIYLVISHCNHSLSWLPDFTEKFIIHNITIYSKCGQTPDFVPQDATIISLPNIGGCHHTYSYWMANMKPEDIGYDNAIFFLTDDREIKDWGRPRSMYQMLNVASRFKFACWLTPIKSRDYAQSDVSAYHKPEFVFQFQANGAATPFQTWVKNMNIDVPTNAFSLTNVCYGSNFVVKGSQIREMNKSTFEKIENNLAHAGNIPEEEYAERIWAEIFSSDIGAYKKEKLNEHTSGQLTHYKYQGTLIREDR